MPQFRDRVKDTTTTTGTGTITVSGTAPTGYQAFGTAFTTGTPRIAYTIASASGSEWEVGFGTLVTSTTLSRDRISSSSNSNTVVNFSAGTKDVWCDLPAEFARDLVPRGRIETQRFGAMTL
jgi:hypothetical protein